MASPLRSATTQVAPSPNAASRSPRVAPAGRSVGAPLAMTCNSYSGSALRAAFLARL